MLSWYAKRRVPPHTNGMGSLLNLGWVVSSVPKTIRAFLTYVMGANSPPKNKVYVG